MGNNQSQNEDLEQGRLTYNYHENVLREAQQLCDSSSGGYESDDQYHSAEEGDDSDRSITPPRDRPESSSGEDFSDDSANEDEHGAEGGNNNTSQLPGTFSESNLNLVDSLPMCLAPANISKRLLVVKDSPGRGNTSSFLEHDSIGPELDRSRWDASANQSSVRNTRQSSQRCHTGILSGQRVTSFSTSPFVPISSPPYYQNASMLSSTGNSVSLKRKANQSFDALSEEQKNFSPKRRHTFKLSPNKRRLGILDESDSDSDDGNSRGRASTKKKSRPGTQLPQVANETEGYHLKRSVKEHSDEDFVTEAMGSSKKGKFTLRTEKLNVLGKRSLEQNKSDKICRSSGNSPEMKTFKADNHVVENANSQVSNVTTQQPVVSDRLQGSAFQSLNGGSNTTTSHQENERVHRSITKTMKMGSDAVRNSLGKVVPLRNSHHDQPALGSLSSSDVAGSSIVTQPVQKSQSETVLSNDNNRSLRLRSYNESNRSGFTSTSDAGIKNGLDTQTHGCDISHAGLESPQGSENKKSTIPSSVAVTVGHIQNISPFQNVVLTPPSSSTSLTDIFNDRSLKRGVDDSNCIYSSITGNISNEDAMETDESQSGLDSMETQPYTPRRIVAAKRSQSLTTAQRFKNFFTDGSLKSNFKTLFFKKKNDLGRESHSNTPANQSAWSLYSSPSSSLFGQSSLPNQHVFQSTSSPIDLIRSQSDSSIHFSPNISKVANPSPHASMNCQSGRLSATPSSLKAKKKVTKSLSAGHIATRTSPRLSRLRASGDPSILNVSTDFQDSSGSNTSKDEVELLPQTSEFQVLHFRLSQTLEISLALGDIAEQSSAGLVNWTDGALTHNARECSRGIRAKAGALMRAGCNSYIDNKDGALEAPDVLTTPAGGRFPRSVVALLHVVSPPRASGARLAPCLLETNANCFRFASERLNLDSLSMPLIGEGELPTEMCAEAFIDALLIFVTENKSQQIPSTSPSLSSSSFTSQPGNVLSSIHLVTADANVTDHAAEAIQARIDCVKTNSLDSVVADIRSRYYGQQESSLVEMCNDDETKTTCRAKSGRPLVKRPRL